VGFLELVVLHGLDGIAVVYAKDPFSADLAKSSEKWIRRLGLNLVLYKGFKKGTKSLDTFAQKARENGADVLMVCGHMQEAVSMTRSLDRLNWRPRAFYASVGPALQSFYDQCGGQAEQVFATSLWEPRANYPGAREFEKAYIKAYGNRPGYHAGLAYAAGQVLNEAVREAGSLDRDRVLSALFKMDTMTLIGRFGVDSTGKQVRQHTFIIQWQKGRKELVWPREIRTAEPLF
jgi:branched-chain amino acid transport system substrate-binding protein